MEETEQGLEPDSDIEAVWELSNQEFKTTTINMLKTPLHKTDSLQEQMGNVSSGRIQRKNQEMVENKNTDRN